MSPLPLGACSQTHMPPPEWDSHATPTHSQRSVVCVRACIHVCSMCKFKCASEHYLHARLRKCVANSFLHCSFARAESQCVLLANGVFEFCV